MNPLLRFLGCMALLLFLVPLISAMDLSRGVLLDIPDRAAEKQFGPIPPTRLTPAEQKAMADFRFVDDTLRVLAVPVEWDDRPATWPRETLDSMLFSRDIYPPGSVVDYFHEVSYGKVAVVGDVIDWFNAGLYNPYFDFESILPALDAIVDFSQYDGNGDNDVDALIFLRSGTGEEDSQDPNDIWSFAYVYAPNGGPGPFDGKYISRWNTSPELYPLRDPVYPLVFSGVDTLNDIRVFCHELSHNFGMPDLYDYDAKLDVTTYYTPADANDHPLVDWCLMGYGGYGLMSLKSNVPSHLCGWNKQLMGWAQPIDLVGTFEDLVIYDIETHDDSALYRIPINPAEGEYFLLEFRNPQSSGMFDKTDSDFSVLFWPDVTYGADSLDRGLLITHVHDSLGANFWRINAGWPDYPHYTVAVEDAGYNPGMDQYSNPEGHITDSAQWLYPWETRRAAPFSHDVPYQEEFGPTTTPGSEGYTTSTYIIVRVDSIVGDRLYAYVSNQINDADGDLVADEIDNCPLVYNPDQTDLDGDGLGIVCDDCVDTDADGYGNPGYDNSCADDNCPDDYNPDQTDHDSDGIGDVCDHPANIGDTVSTGCLQLHVSSSGNFGNRGQDGATMDFSDFGDCDPFATVYIYDGSPMLTYELASSPVCYNSMYDKSLFLGEDGHAPVPTQTTADYQVFESGTIVTPDFKVAMDKTWWAPSHPDSCTFIIQRLRVYSYWGQAQEGVWIGEAIDWDIPSDISSYNNGGYDADEHMLYIQGMEIDGFGCQPNDHRYGAMSMLGYYINDPETIDTSSGPHSAYIVDNETYIYPYGGWDADLTAALITQYGYGVLATEQDLSMVMTYVSEYYVSPGDTLNIFTILTSVENDPSKSGSDERAYSQILENLQKARQWTNDHVITLPYYICGDANGDETINISDAVFLVNYIFKGGPPPVPVCVGDVNGDYGVNIGDVVYIVDYVFKGGPPPVDYCCDWWKKSAP